LYEPTVRPPQSPSDTRLVGGGSAGSTPLVIFKAVRGRIV
jgi:hypothetical protein